MERSNTDISQTMALPSEANFDKAEFIVWYRGGASTTACGPNMAS